MNIPTDGLDGLSLAIDGLRTEVDRWINEQKGRLRVLEEGGEGIFDDASYDEPVPVFTPPPLRVIPAARASAIPPPGPASTKRPGQEDSSIAAARPTIDPTSSRERLDALARHLNDRLRRNKDQSSDRITPPSVP